MTDQTIIFRPLEGLDDADVTAALNAAYADYFTPTYLTPASFREATRRDDIRLDASLAALADGQVVGMAWLGVRGRRGWVEAVGVIPSYRRRGIARSLLRQIIEQGKALGLATIQLEVITENQPAYDLYRSLGFTTRRDFVVLTSHGAAQGLVSHQPDLFIEASAPATLVESLARFPAPERPWQREVFGPADRLSRLQGLAAHRRSTGRLEGVCLYAGNAGHGNLIDLVAETPAVGHALVEALFDRNPVTGFMYINVLEDDPLLPTLYKAGFDVMLRQHEMILHLDEETHT